MREREEDASELATEAASDAAADYPIKSVRKAIAILNALSQARRPLRISELAGRLQMSVSATSRLMTTLSSGGLTYQDEETGRCYLGLGLTVLGSDALGRRELDHLAIPVLDELVGRLDCYVSLSRLERGRVVIMRARATSFSPRDLSLFSVVPMHACAPGKVLASALGEESIRAILAEQGLDPFTANTLTCVDAFLSEVEAFRSCGFALDNEEIAYGLRHVATPIYDEAGRVVAAISAGGRLPELPLENMGALLRTLHLGCLRISRELGFRGTPPLDLGRFAVQDGTPGGDA
ncbi:IclR family transcriptional regulator [Chelatococcus reniformis]|uniref:IclR family transcriptional regulator n=1 Tax=Chelatococcus reniformis TaxID=1494448 RepID=A0A916UBD7_9HYPH|nr:IclR family transcriptional regulator [Chelatococcus reniformis]GGC65577.1 IclR family transcriptional regulator [Chelatococcus reniformis]